MNKPVYVPAVAEQTLPVDRPTAWPALLDQLRVAAVGDTRTRQVADQTVTETAISVEAPWRLVIDATGGACPFHQETIVLVPHADGCLAMWSSLVSEPADDAAHRYADEVATQTPRRLADLTANIAISDR